MTAAGRDTMLKLLVSDRDRHHAVGMGILAEVAALTVKPQSGGEADAGKRTSKRKTDPPLRKN